MALMMGGGTAKRREERMEGAREGCREGRQHLKHNLAAGI